MQVLLYEAASPSLPFVALAKLAANRVLHERQGACLRVASVAAIVGTAVVGKLVVSYVPPGDLREARAEAAERLAHKGERHLAAFEPRHTAVVVNLHQIGADALSVHLVVLNVREHHAVEVRAADVVLVGWLECMVHSHLETPSHPVEN